MREHLEQVGSELRFGARATELVVRDGRAIGVRLADGGEVIGRAVVVATGHSARDVHELLDRARACASRPSRSRWACGSSIRSR